MDVLRKDVEVVGGVSNQFVGIRLGEFLLVPDSDSGMRPDALRVERGDDSRLLLRGGTALRVEVFPTGISREGFLKHLNSSQVKMLSRLAFNLPGRSWPAAGELLREHWEAMMREEEIVDALRNLYQGVGRVMRWIRFLSRIPIFGKRLAEKLFPLSD
jgi:hypothetical protein